MSEFVGRTGHKRNYSYPVPRFTGLVGPFARNYATGPAGETPTAIGTGPGTVVPWNFIAVGGAGTDVPITPKATGYLRITGMLTIVNTGGSPESVQVQVQIGLVSLSVPAEEEVTVPAGDSVAIPIFAEVDPTISPNVPVGSTRDIEILLTASGGGLGLVGESSILDIQEVQKPTG